MNSTNSTPSRWNGIAIFLVVAVLIVAWRWDSLREVFSGGAFPPTAFEWQHDWSEAEKLASEQQKPRLVVFSASWCPPCKHMKRTVWPDAQVGEIVSSSYIPLYVDVDMPEYETQVSKYGVSAIPLVLILDQEGNVTRRANTMSTSETIQFLKP